MEFNNENPYRIVGQKSLDMKNVKQFQPKP